MTIDWASFTPLHSLTGGVLIGLAVAMLLLINGRIAGISGIIGGLLAPSRNDILWRILFLLGLVVSPVLYALFAGLPESRIDAEWPLLMLAGLLVGFGTRLGSGCTSGHGVCGLSRLSPRSIVATSIFMGFGFATVYAVRHLLS